MSVREKKEERGSLRVLKLFHSKKLARELPAGGQRTHVFRAGTDVSLHHPRMRSSMRFIASAFAPAAARQSTCTLSHLSSSWLRIASSRVFDFRTGELGLGFHEGVILIDWLMQVTGGGVWKFEVEILLHLLTFSRSCRRLNL